MVRSFLLLPILAVAVCVSGAPVSDNSAMMYLAQYGYISKINFNSSSIADNTKFSTAVADFQSFAGLNVTGELDNETIETMALPRCGIQDKVGTGSDVRSKRYARQGSRWKSKNIRYRINNYPSKLKQSQVDNEIQRAFNVWTEDTDLTFSPSDSQGDIEIWFRSGEHGDGDPFDGMGGTLGHAFFPGYGGDAHFDASEKWSVNVKSGINLFQVAAHEFGHSLGLSHSDVNSALMAPFYKGYKPNFRLDKDDIDGIQAVYGKKTRKNPESPSVAAPGTNVDTSLCSDSKFDTIFKTAEGSTYIFKGNNYWQLSDYRILPGYPKQISNDWPGLSGNIDAAFTYKNGKTYFFKGKQYWRYVGMRMDGVFPKNISEGFAGIPDDIDAVTVWSGNGKIFFFKGSKFWRFDHMQRPPVKSSYPKPISNWGGIPNNIDAAFISDDGFTYFFKDGFHFRFNDMAFSVDGGNPAYPRSTAKWWFGCKQAARGSSFSRGFISSDFSGSHQSRHSDENLSRSGSHHHLASAYITIAATLLIYVTTS